MLGMKGMFAQAQLHIIRARLHGSKLNKAQKGELRFPLPVVWYSMATKLLSIPIRKCKARFEQSSTCSIQRAAPLAQFHMRWYFVFACALRMLAKSGHRAWSVVEAGAPRRLSMWAQTGSLGFPGDPSRTFALLRDAGRTGKPDHSGFPGAAPGPTQHGEGFSTTMISRLATGLRYPLSALRERCCHRPCKTRFRLAGSAFSGRASNPLGHDERFLTTFILLSRTYPDASWVHMRRNFYELAVAGPAPIASEALTHIAAFYAIEKEIRDRSPQERRLVLQQKSRPLAEAFGLAACQAGFHQPEDQARRRHPLGPLALARSDALHR